MLENKYIHENAVVQLIVTRRSVRNYQTHPVEPNLLDALLETALYAPTGGNHQYTRFLAVTNLRILEEINDIVRDEFAGRELDPNSYQNKTVIKAKKEGYNCMYHAPVLIIAVAPINHGNSMADSANALENIQLAATALQLGACWINQLHWLTENERMRSYLYKIGMMETESVFGSVAVGYPSLGSQTAGRPLRKAGRIVKI